RRRASRRTSSAQAASPGCFPPPCVLIPPLAGATAARERPAPRAASRRDPSVPRPWPASVIASAWRSHGHWWAACAAMVGDSWHVGGKICSACEKTPAPGVSTVRGGGHAIPARVNGPYSTTGSAYGLRGGGTLWFGQGSGKTYGRIDVPRPVQVNASNGRDLGPHHDHRQVRRNLM